jgi:superfamily I DNA and/or RNA helicase
LFYKNQISVKKDSSSQLLKKLKLTKAVQFCDVRGEETNPFNPSAWVNEKEAKYCVDLILKLCRNDLHPNQIGVITPCKSQARLISTQLKNRIAGEPFDGSNDQIDQKPSTRRDGQAPKRFKSSDYSSCKIGTVEEFQGDERDIIIISTVRSLSPCCLVPSVELKRFNIATSRARQLLIAVGNEAALSTCRYWRSFMGCASEEIQDSSPQDGVA